MSNLRESAHDPDPDDNDTEADLTQEQRYRRAAEDALQQLDWCIGYLHGIRKMRISAALSRNRDHIRTELMGRSREALPSSVTSEQ